MTSRSNKVLSRTLCQSREFSSWMVEHDRNLAHSCSTPSKLPINLRLGVRLYASVIVETEGQYYQKKRIPIGNEARQPRLGHHDISLVGWLSPITVSRAFCLPHRVALVQWQAGKVRRELRPWALWPDVMKIINRYKASRAPGR